MTDDTYNGWTNRATWALNLHIENTEGWYRDFLVQADHCITEAELSEHEDPTDARAEAIDSFAMELEQWVDELYELIEEAATTAGEVVGREAWLLLMDVGTDTSKWAINYTEIAEAWITENLDGRLS